MRRGAFWLLFVLLITSGCTRPGSAGATNPPGSAPPASLGSSPTRSGTATRRACTGDDLAFVPTVDGASMGLVPLVDLRFRGREPCHLGVTLHLTIEGHDGAKLLIEGNGRAIVVDRDLPEDPLGAAWWWRNWCGDSSESFVFDVTGWEQDVRWEFDNSPVCTSGDDPSTLVPFGP